MVTQYMIYLKISDMPNRIENYKIMYTSYKSNVSSATQIEFFSDETVNIKIIDTILSKYIDIYSMRII